MSRVRIHGRVSYNNEEEPLCGERLLLLFLATLSRITGC